MRYRLWGRTYEAMLCRETTKGCLFITQEEGACKSLTSFVGRRRLFRRSGRFNKDRAMRMLWGL